MTINGETLIAVIEEMDELRAKHLVMRDALDHAHAIARKAMLPQPDYPELCAKIREVLDKARKLCDSLMTAAQRKGYELADEEILDLAKAAGGWTFLSGEGQIQWLAARKRAAHNERNGGQYEGKAVTANPHGDVSSAPVRSLSIHRD